MGEGEGAVALLNSILADAYNCVLADIYSCTKVVSECRPFFKSFAYIRLSFAVKLYFAYM